MERLVHVATAGNAVEGQLLRGRLEIDGIPVFTKGEGDGPYRMGPMFLWVPEEYEVQARLLLAEMLDGRLELPEDEDVRLVGDEPVALGDDDA
jgi:hypothetical protein